MPVKSPIELDIRLHFLLSPEGDQKPSSHSHLTLSGAVRSPMQIELKPQMSVQTLLQLLMQRTRIVNMPR
jgi:hypothetical protein